MTTEAAMASELAADAMAVTGRLLALWPGLAEARAPGVPGTHLLVTRRRSDWEQLVEDEMVRRDRRAAGMAIREGRVPSGEHPVPVRLGPVQARLQVAVAARVTASSVGLVMPVLAEPDASRCRPCSWCAGTGRAQRPVGWLWRWPGDPWVPVPGDGAVGDGAVVPPPCALCGGHGRFCPTCGTLGGCGCTLADVVVDALLRALTSALPQVTDLKVAQNAAGELGRAERAARQALGMHDLDLRVLAAPCPACERRELACDVTSDDRRAWSISCRSALCRCTGPDCGCGRPTRWQGRRHRWPSWEFGALADRLGVRLPEIGGGGG